jgi:Tol biopolymer transport system component
LSSPLLRARRAEKTAVSAAPRISPARSFAAPAALVALAAIIALLAPAAPAAAQFGKNKIQYREFDWKIYHSPHFDIYHYEQEASQLEKIASLAESAYDRLTREFDHQVQDPIPLIFYLTHSAFEQNNIIMNFIPEGIGAFASPVRNRMVLPIDLEDGELFALIMHELTHIFQYDILYRGKLSRSVASNAPQWFMEGMASYMAKDESTQDQMYLRDAVVNDSIPSILERGISGFLAYRFGHAAFDYIEERWGKEGFRDFLYEYRNTFGGRPERAVERSFRIDPEDFDLDFRRWLRKKYLPKLVETGEPSDFGRPFRDDDGKISSAISPAASPSGDLVAAFAITRGDLDIVLFDTKSREPIANLTKGYTNEYEYLVSQFITAGSRMGRDLAFSADGNYLAAFAKREKGRALLIFDVLDRKLVKRIEMEVEQQHSPAFSPDGKTIAFTGNVGGQFDVFLIDLESEQVTNLTNDTPYDGAPTYSLDGKSIVFSVASGEDNANLYRLDLADPATRYRLTEGDWRDKDAVFASHGLTLVFTSDRNGADNIYAMQLDTGKVFQLTNAVTGCFMPTLLPRHGAIDQLVYTGFWKGKFDLYLGDLENAVGESQVAVPSTEPAAADSVEAFEPDIRVSLDPANTEEYGGFKLFVEDAGASVGVASDQTLLGYTYISMTDLLGDRRLILNLSSIESFSNFNVLYVDLSHRYNWSVEAFDNRQFYYEDLSPVQGDESQRQELQFTGAIGSWVYPFDLHHRMSLGLGYIYQKQSFLFLNQDPETGESFIDSIDQKFDYPLAQASFTGDSTLFTENGPTSGRRYRFNATYAHDLDLGGDLYTRYDFEIRQYFEVSQRTSIALRLFTGYSDGNINYPYYFGGLDDLRGVDFRSIVGDRAFFANFEYRFPLVDFLATPFLSFRGIRGRVFLDVGGAWYDRFGQDFEFWNSEENRLEDAISSYGWGVTFNFGGIALNWDFARLWDFKDNLGSGFETQFWIGSRF